MRLPEGGQRRRHAFLWKGSEFFAITSVGANPKEERREDVLLASTFSMHGSKLKSLFLLLEGAHSLQKEVVRWREKHHATKGAPSF
jgi:hypothetical protein